MRCPHPFLFSGPQCFPDNTGETGWHVELMAYACLETGYEEVKGKQMNWLSRTSRRGDGLVCECVFVCVQ